MSPALALLASRESSVSPNTARPIAAGLEVPRLSVCAGISVAIFFLTRVVIHAASVHVRVRWVLLPTLFAEHLESCRQLGGLPGPVLGADILLLLSGKEILVNPDLQGLIILALQAFKPETHAYPLAQSSLNCCSESIVQDSQ